MHQGLSHVVKSPELSIANVVGFFFAVFMCLQSFDCVWGCVYVCAFGCLVVAGWWAMRWPCDLSRLLNNKKLFRYSHGDSMKGAAQRQGEGGGCWWVGVWGSLGLDIALLCGRWETHYFSLLYPATPCFGCFPCFAFTSSLAMSVFPLCGLHSPLSRSVCCQLKLPFFLHGSYLFHLPTSPFLPLSLFLFFLWAPLTSSPAI